MANIVAPKYCLSIFAALAAGALKAVLVSTATGPSGSNYSFNPLTSEFLAEVPAGAIIAPAVALTALAAVLVGQVGNLNAGPRHIPHRAVAQRRQCRAEGRGGADLHRHRRRHHGADRQL
jgi:hypothetical protein